MATYKSFWIRNKRYEKLSVPVLVLVVIGALTTLVLLPQINQAWNDYNEIGDLRRTVGVLKSKQSFLQNLNSAELQTRAQKLEEVLPNEEDLGYFLTSVRSLARRTGIQLKGVSLLSGGSSESEEAPGVPAVARRQIVRKPKENLTRLGLTTQGTLQQLEQFLAEAETSAPIVKVENFTFSQISEGQDYSANMTVSFRYEPSPASIGRADAPLSPISGAEDQLYDQILELKLPETTVLPTVPTGNQRLFL